VFFLSVQAFCFKSEKLDASKRMMQRTLTSFARLSTFASFGLCVLRFVFETPRQPSAVVRFLENLTNKKKG